MIMNSLYIWNILVELWNNRRVIIPTMSAFFIVSVIFALLIPNSYTSTVSMLPSGSGGGPFGFISGWLPGMLESMTSDEISSYLFPDILKSRIVIINVVNEPFDSILQLKVEEKNLKQYHNWTSDEAAFKEFLNYAQVRYSIEKGIIQITFESRDPYLSYFTTKTWVEKLGLFLENNLETKSKRNYEYLLDKQKDSNANLKAAEDSLAFFFRANKNFQSNPITNLEYQRLSINIQSKRDIFKYISQQLETEKLNMVKSRPTVNILDKPNIPRKKSGPQRSIIVLLGLFFGCLFCLLVIFVNRFRITIMDSIHSDIEDNS